MLSLEMEDDAVWGIHFGFSLLRPEEPQPTPVYLTVPFHHAAGGGGNGNNDDRDRMVLLNDGNLVVIDASRRQLWSSETANVAPGPYTLTMQDDGDCVLFGGSGVRLWASGTSGWG